MKYKIQIQLSSLDKTIIKSYSRFLAKYLTVEQIKFSFISMPVKTKKLTLQRSPHVYKKAREQFQLSTYKVVVLIEQVNSVLFKHLLLAKPTSLSLVFKYK